MEIPSFLFKRSDGFLIAGIVLIFFFIIIIGLSAILVQQQKTEQEIQDGLTLTAELKATSISDWYQERLADATVAMKSQTLIEYLQSQTNPGRYDITEADVSTWLSSMVAQYHYHGIVLLNETGSVLLAYPRDAGISGLSMNATYKKALASDEPVFTDIFLEPEMNDSSMEFWVPMRDRHTTLPLGILVLQVRAEDHLYPLIQSWPTRSATAESLITRQEGNSILFLTNLRHVPDAALRYSVPVTSENVPAVLAARGYRGIVKGPDYRGVPVVAAITNITGTPWFIISKIDQDEIYAPFSQFLWVTIGGIILLLCIAGFGTLLVWRTREKEYVLRELHQKEHELSLAERVRLIMQQANDPILILDKDWRILEVNDRAVELYGFTPQEFQDKTLFDLRTESAKQTVEDDLKRLGDREGIIVETEHQKKDGTRFVIESSIRGRTVHGILIRQAIIRDISERKKIEHELQDKNTELQALNEEMAASYEELASQQEEMHHQMESLRQNEIQLQVMQNRLSEAQQAGHVGVWEYSLRSRRVWGSDEAFRIYGLSFCPDMEKDLEEVLACIPDRKRVESALDETIRHDIPFTIEFRIHPPDGSPDRVVSVLARLHRDEGEKPDKVVGIIQDITEKREFEEEIRQYQEKLSVLFGSPLLGILFGDVYGSINQVNDAFLQITGYSRDDYLSEQIGLKDITPEEFLPLDEEMMALAKKTGNCPPYEKQFRRRDGSLIWVLVGYILVGPSREESVALILDITERKRNEEAISLMNQTLEERVIERTNQLTFINEELQTEIEERIGAEKQLQEILSLLSATLESSEDGILVVNMTGKVTLYNKTFVEMWHIPETVMWNRDEKEIVHELVKLVSDPDGFFTVMERIHAEPDSETADTITLADNRIFERFSKPQRIGYTLAGRVWSFRDVTRRNEMEQQIERSLREKEILLKEIHHRVKNNMQVVSSLLFMQSRLSTDEHLKEILRESQNRVKSIALVHEELYQSMDLDRIDFNRYLQKISRYIFETYKVDASRISMKLSDDMVHLTISKAVPCSLIVNELISNSLKHAFPGDRTGSIMISFVRDHDRYHLSYRDDGVGIPESVTSESPKTLGLELVKGLVKQLSGTIEMNRAGGTRYDITFPA